MPAAQPFAARPASLLGCCVPSSVSPHSWRLPTPSGILGNARASGARQFGAAAPTAEHLPPRRASTLGFRFPPLVLVVRGCRPLRAYGEVRAPPARRELGAAASRSPNRTAFAVRWAASLNLQVSPRRSMSLATAGPFGHTDAIRTWLAVSRAPAPHAARHPRRQWVSTLNLQAAPSVHVVGGCPRFGHIMKCARICWPVSTA